MSHPSTQSAFSAPSFTSRRRTFDTAVVLPTDHASAYRAAHGPRIPLPYQSAYQRDYAAVERYMAIKADQQRRQPTRGIKDEEEEEDEGAEQADSSEPTWRSDSSSRTEREEDSGQMSESELKADSESVLDEAGEAEIEEHQYVGRANEGVDDEEAAEEMRASSTFVAYQPDSDLLQDDGEDWPATSSAPSSHTQSHSHSNPPSASAASSAARSLHSSHTQQTARHSIPSQPIHAWQPRPARKAQYDNNHVTARVGEQWDIERGADRQLSSTQFGVLPDRQYRMRREDDPAIQRLRESLQASRLGDLPPPSSSLSSTSATPSASTSASTSTSSSPPIAPIRRLVGDRDSDWRPSRRIIRPHNQSSDPAAFRYTPVASYPVSAAASLPSSVGDSGTSSPTREYSSRLRLRGETARIDPSSVPYAAGMPSHRRGTSSPYGGESVASALSAVPSLLSATPLLSSSLSSSRSMSLSHTPPTVGGDRAGRGDRLQAVHVAERLRKGGSEGSSGDSSHVNRVVVGTEQADSRKRPVGGDGQKKESGQHGREAKRAEYVGEEEIERAGQGEELKYRSRRHVPIGQRKQEVRNEQVQTEDRRMVYAHSAAGAAATSAHGLGNAAYRDHSATPTWSSSAAMPSFPRAAASPLASTPMTGYGYADVTPGSIERRKERERQEYEADLKRIREDQSNVRARVALRERNHTALQPL